MNVRPLAEKPADASVLVNVPWLASAYYTVRTDPAVPEQRFAFRISAHRGSAVEKAFREGRILAIVPAMCLYRGQHGNDGLARGRGPEGLTH